MSALRDATESVAVTVTFLRMSRAPVDPGPVLPDRFAVAVADPCPVPLYRTLYDTVGTPHLWWLRRMMPDAELDALLRHPAVSVHLLRDGGTISGFYELDARNWPVINLAYFGLMPHAVGAGIGYAFLRHAVATAWARGPAAMTVNTCTADHPRAMPTYLRAGFRQLRQVREVWNIPVRLGLTIPPALAQQGKARGFSPGPHQGQEPLEP